MLRSLLTALSAGLVLAGVLAASPAGDAAPSTPPAPLTPDPAAAPATLNVVVLADGPAAFIEQVSRWTPARRFPVLIEDGSYASVQNAARFIRAFKPAAVVRAAGGAALPVDDPAAMETAIRAAHLASWGVPDVQALEDRWRATTHLPAGMVVFDPRDRAWPGALALAAGRGQLLVRFDKPASWGGVDGALSLAEAMPLVDLTSAVFRGWMPDKARANTMRAVTLALNAPARVQLAGGERVPSVASMVCQPGESLALTDVLGRLSQGGTVTVARWGVAGQTPGGLSDSAYRAMCALFLEPASAFVFDGYNAGAGFDDYDGTRAAEELRGAGLKVESFDRPDNRPVNWRTATGKGLSADLVLINSHGMRDVFNLADAPVTCGDVPALDRPAAVWMVHSWAAVSPMDRWTVAGRWMERGAYAFVGSVHEPFLAAFVPTPALARSVMAGTPLGAAIRRDAPPWRIALIGDPLLTLKPGGRPARAAFTVGEGYAPLDRQMRDDLKAKNLAPALRALVLLGRDKDAARLAAAALNDRPADVTPDMALDALGSAFREGDERVFFTLLKIAAPRLDPMSDPAAGGLDALDMAWQAAYVAGDKLTDEQVDILAALVRGGGGKQGVRDAQELARVVEARRGKDAARALLQKIADTTKVPGLADQLREAMRR